MKRAAIIAGVVAVALLLPIMFMSVLLVLSGDQPSPSDKALDEIPTELIGVYRAAAETCEGLSWTVLAAVHKVETGFGDGRATSSKGAQGPMQFMPSTFASYGIDGDGDGRADIVNVIDAIFSAANLLCANGAGDPGRLASAVWNYNHSQAYVDEVIALAVSYGEPTIPGGYAFAASGDLLDNPAVVLSPNARADLEAGIIDQRVVSLLAWIAQRHSISVSVLKTGHSKYVRNTSSVSNHYYGRAADISVVDGEPVSISSLAARRLVLEIAALQGSLRPSEIGHPFADFRFLGGFTDADHSDHVHIGYDSSN